MKKQFLKIAIAFATLHFLFSSILTPFCISTQLAGTQAPLFSKIYIINHIAYLLMGVLSFPLSIFAKLAPGLYSFLSLPAKGLSIWVQVELLLLLNSMIASLIFSTCFVAVPFFIKLIKKQITEEEYSDLIKP